MSRDFAFKDHKPADPVAMLQQHLQDTQEAYQAAQQQMTGMANLMAAGTPPAGDEDAWTSTINTARAYPAAYRPGMKLP